MYSLIFTQSIFGCNRRFAPVFMVLMCTYFFNANSYAQDVLMGLTSNGGAEGKGTIFSIKTDTKAFNVIKGFADYGTNPVNDLVQGPDGAFYGMTPTGGTYSYGTLFRITAAGEMTILKHFNYTTDGGSPKGSLLVAKDGALYGTTASGGANYGGTIFKITTAGIFTVIRNLNSGTDGGSPYCHLIQAIDGLLYGTNYSGGATGYGTVFKMATTGSSYTVLKTFNGTDGSYPYGSSLVQGTDGAFYGMTYMGGTNNRGVIFRITATGSFTVLRHLNSATDGQYPYGSLIQAKDGYLYGMTYSGGTEYGGTIFKINTTGSTFKVLKNLYSSTVGGNPNGSLVEAKDGYLYGMTYYSPSGTTATAGEVFKISTSGTFTIIRKFNAATEGGYPRGSLVQATDGALYGMTSEGGKNGKGTLFKVTTGGTLTVLNHFNNDSYGIAPQDNLALGKDSAYFGVTTAGGSDDVGTIFKVCGDVTTILRSLTRITDGANPVGGLVRAKDGNLYGTTSYGGKNGAGTIFKITPSGTFTVLRHLLATTDGAYPEATLVEGVDGMLYGSAPNGGSGNYGTIFKINTTGTTFTILRHLSSATDGGNVRSALVLAKDGFFYGYINGSVNKFFKISSTGTFTALHTFVYGTEGNNPKGAPLQGADGAFYGVASTGGTNYHGTIFKITATGTVTVLRHLSGPTDGKTPVGSLMQGSDGALYGTASSGGTYNAGTIFRITTAKSFSVLRHLTMATDGGTPLGGFVIAPKIALVATAQMGLTTNEDVAKAITLSGTGATNLTYTIVTGPKNGSVTTGTSASRTYTPGANFNGKDSFAFVSNLGCLSSAPAWIKISVASVNDAPVLATIANKTVVKGSLLNFTATATDADAGQTKTFTLISPPSGATITSAGVFNWTPSTVGTYTLKVRVTDNGSPVAYSEKTFTVTVTTPALTTTTLAANSLAIGKEENVGRAKATLFPNPATSEITISLPQAAENSNLTVVDSKGAIILRKQYSATSLLKLNVVLLKAGAYIALVETSNGRQALSFIKQ